MCSERSGSPASALGGVSSPASAAVERQRLPEMPAPASGLAAASGSCGGADASPSALPPLAPQSSRGLLTHLALTQFLNILADLLSVACSSETRFPGFLG